MIEEDEPILEKAIGYVITDICKKKNHFFRDTQLSCVSKTLLDINGMPKSTSKKWSYKIWSTSYFGKLSIFQDWNWMVSWKVFDTEGTAEEAKEGFKAHWTYHKDWRLQKLL